MPYESSFSQLTPRYSTDIDQAILAIAKGQMVIMVDEADRENEGDLVFAAEFASQALINFMAKEARGLICLTLEPEIVSRLNLPMMNDSTKVAPNQSTAFTVSIEARHGVTTGISAADRAHTVKVAISDQSTPDDLVVPGHIFPLKARSGGVLERAGHTEGSVDIAKMAGLKGAAVICEIMNDDGSMARMPDLEMFAKKHSIPIVAISDLIKYRLLREPMLEIIEQRPCKTAYGTFDSFLFENRISKQQHFAMTKGTNFANHVVDVRVHNQRPLADIFGMKEHHAGFRLHYGLNMLKTLERAVFLYLFEDTAKSLMLDDFLNMSLPREQKTEVKKVHIEDRMLGTGSLMLRQLGIQRMRLHSTMPRNYIAISGFGLGVVESVLMTLD